MKAVIIGGGIAGLAAGLFLKRKGINVVINERFSDFKDRGHGFLMHPNGLSILDELNFEKKHLKLPGVSIQKANFQTPDQKRNEAANLKSWRCMRRCDIIDYLINLYPSNEIKKDREFAEFILEGGKAIAAVFTNGEVEYGDLFIGADGAHSKVRNYIIGETQFTNTLVNEIVGVADNSTIATSYEGQFIKFQDENRGLAFGFIPLNTEKLVWFIQYDISLIDFDGSTPEKLKDMCFTLLKEFPPLAFDTLKSTDFTKPYIWKTKDFDLINTFHRNNVVVIGDAAHLALPFTSAGATNALVDAKMLGECMEKHKSYEEIFSEFYVLRSQVIALHVELGRELQQRFLYPAFYSDAAPAIPLIA